MRSRSYAQRASNLVRYVRDIVGACERRMRCPRTRVLSPLLVMPPQPSQYFMLAYCSGCVLVLDFALASNELDPTADGHHAQLITI